jgi:hypothetical protein
MPLSLVPADWTAHRMDAVVAMFRAASPHGWLGTPPPDAAAARPLRPRRVVAFLGANEATGRIDGASIAQVIHREGRGTGGAA